MISKTSIIYEGVKLGENVTIEDYCIIGAQPRGGSTQKTIIGDNALIRSHTVIYAGNTIGVNFSCGNKVNIRENNVIGDTVSIGTLTVIEHHIHIEDDVRIHSQSFIPEYCILKQGCWIGPNVVLTNAKFPLHKDVKDNLKGVVVNSNAKIGANVTILPGLIIGENSLIGAGSVVTKHVDSDIIVAGTPAIKIRNIDY